MRKADLTPEGWEKHLAYCRERAQDPARREYQRAYHRQWVANLSPEKIAEMNRRNKECRKRWLANLTPEQKEYWRQYRKDYYHKHKNDGKL